MQREELPSAEFYDAIRARRRRIACARCFIAPKPFNVFDAEMSSPHACCQAGGITVAAACDVWTSLCRVSDDAAWCGVRAVSDDGGEIKEMSGLSHLR